MARYIPNPISSIMAGLSDLNANLTAIKTAVDRMLSRKSGDGDNSMEVDLDMNSNRVLNLPVPVNAAEPARHGDIQEYVDAAEGFAEDAEDSATASAASATAAATSADEAEAAADEAEAAADEAETWRDELIALEIWEPEALTYFAGAIDDWNAEEQLKVNTAIRRMKDSGLWDKMEIFYNFAGPSIAAASVNLIDPSSYPITVNGGVTFAPYVGFTGDRITGYLGTGYTLGTAGRNQGAMGVWVTSGEPEDSRAAIGMNNTNYNFLLYPHTSSGTLNARWNNAVDTPMTAEVEGPQGLSVVVREDATNLSLYKDGVHLATESWPVTAEPSNTNIAIGEFQFLRWGPLGTSTGGYGLAIGFYSIVPFTAEEVATLYDIWDDYLKSIEAINVYNVSDPDFVLDPDDTLLVSRDKVILQSISYRQLRASLFRGQRNVETLEILDRLENDDVPTAGQLNAMDDAISAFKLQGYWDEFIDSFVYFANANQRLSLIDWKNPARNGVAVNSPVFTSQGGFTCSVDNRAYVDTGYAPDEHGIKFDKNTGFLGFRIFSSDAADGNQAALGSARWARTESATNIATLYRSRARITARSGSNALNAVLNSNPTSLGIYGANTDTNASIIMNRQPSDGATNVYVYREGVSIGTILHTANGYPIGNIKIGYDETSTEQRFSNSRFGWFIGGGQMPNDRIAGLQTILDNLVTTLGSS